MVGSRWIAASWLVAAAGCGALIQQAVVAPPDPPPPRVPRPPNTDAVPDTANHYEQLMFIDDGAALLASADSRVAVIDPDHRSVITRVTLDAPFEPAIWQWDATARTLTGVGCMRGGKIAHWTPADESAPSALHAATDCSHDILGLAPDRSWFVARSELHTLRRFAVADGAPLGPPIALVRGAATGVVSPDGAMLAGLGAYGEVQVCELASGQCRSPPAGVDPRTQYLAFDPSRPVLVLFAGRDTVAWDLVRDTTTHIDSAGDLSALAFSADGRQLALAHSRAIEIVDGRRFTPIRSVAVRDDHIGNVGSMVFSPDGTQLAISTMRGLEIHDLAAHAPRSIDVAWLGRLPHLPADP